MLGKDGTELSEQWMSEFRGFFYGDGYLGITSNGKRKCGRYTSYVARAQITLRDDDSAMLYDFMQKLGGHIFHERRGKKVKDENGKVFQSKPYIVWRVVNLKEIMTICDILELGILPSKKIKETKILREYSQTKIKHGKRTSSYEKEVKEIYSKRQELCEKLKAMHAYNGSNGY